MPAKLTPQRTLGKTGVKVPLIEEDVKDAQGEARNQDGEAKPGLFWLHDTAVMGWRQRDEPATVRY